MRHGLFLCLVITSANLFAQENVGVTTPPEDPDSIRNLYITNFPDHFFIYPVLKQRRLSFELEERDGSALLTYAPNTSYSFGVGAYIFEVGVEVAFAVPLDEKQKSIYGDSDARDLQLNLLGKSWGIDAFYQKYTGFYITDRQNPPPADSPFPQRSDINSRNAGVTGTYVFNDKKFSFRSFYNYSERQLQSKGSFLLSASIGRFKMEADSSILNAAQEQLFGAQVSFRQLRYATLSLAPGYTYSLVYRGFFLNGTLSVGPAHHWIRYNLEAGPERDDIGINSFVAARIGIGFNGTRLFGGVSFVTQGSAVRFEDVEFSNNVTGFKILMGYRFLEKGFLKKRAWDLVPFEI